MFETTLSLKGGGKMKEYEKKINTARDLEELKNNDYVLYAKIKQLIINARELQAVRNGEILSNR